MDPPLASPPSLDMVYQGICTLYHNSVPKEKEKASRWLEQFQKSVNIFFFLLSNSISILLFTDFFLENIR